MEDKKQENRAEFEKVFRALGDKHRLQILDLLLEKERNAGELLEQVDVVQSTLSHHMKSLCDSGLVLPRKEGKWTYYAVNSQMVVQAREFLAGYLGQETGVAAEQGKEEADSVTVPGKTEANPEIVAEQRTVAKTEKAEAEPAVAAAQSKKEAEQANSWKLETDKRKQAKPSPYPAEDIDFGDVGVKKTAEPAAKDEKPEIPVVETVYAKMQSQKKKKSKKAKDKKGKDKKGTKKKDTKKQSKN